MAVDKRTKESYRWKQKQQFYLCSGRRGCPERREIFKGKQMESGDQSAKSKLNVEKTNKRVVHDEFSMTRLMLQLFFPVVYCQ